MQSLVLSTVDPNPPSLAGVALSAEELFRRHASFIAGFVMRLGIAREEIDDVVQEVFLTAHRKGGYAPGPARPTTWLAEIALRVVSTHRRTQRRRRVSPDEAAVERAVASGATPFEAAARAQALARVETALAGIDVDRRAVFVLYEIEGESCDSIAHGLRIPLGTVYSRLHAARRDFQKAYRRLSSPEAPSISRSMQGETV